jgi:hypothetical protein
MGTTTMGPAMITAITITPIPMPTIRSAHPA